MPAVVGGQEELQALARLISSAGEGYAARVLEGEAGIGKTTVWRAGVELAVERGFRVLAARPAQAEAKLDFASLADLLASVEDDLLAALPEPQSNALVLALLQATPGAGTDARAVAAGTLGVLSGLAEQTPLLVAIDDLQWLDRPSAAALSFALRRLDLGSRVGVLGATRPPAGVSAAPSTRRVSGR